MPAVDSSARGDTGMTTRFRPAVMEPIYLVFSREQIEAHDISEPLQVLRQLAGNPEEALAACGRISLVIDGYDADPRELFEVPEVRRYIKALDDMWPYWFFFLSQADDSIKIVESCLCDSIEVIPGVTSIDNEQLNAYLTRHFSAMNHYCEALNLPESKIEEISEGVISLIYNSSVTRIEGDLYE
jgi:hypothetical protein